MRNVCFLYGVNGVGKSTLAALVARERPGTLHVSGSAVLREALGAATREELERMGEAEKRAALFGALAELFRRHRRCRLIVCDTHLTVTIRKDGRTTREDMWDPGYLDHGLAYVNVVASGMEVLLRRMEDEKRTGRKRGMDMAEIEEDIRTNDVAFGRLRRHSGTTHVLRNGPRTDTAVRRLLKTVDLALRRAS